MSIPDLSPNPHSPDEVAASVEPAVMDAAQAARKYSVDPEADDDEQDEEEPLWSGQALVYAPKNSKPIRLASLELDGKSVIVDSNLDVDGDVLANDGGAFLYVSGNLTCRNLLAGDALVNVGGDVRATNLALAFGNDGRLRVGGKISAALIACDDHDVECGTTQGITLDVGDRLNDPDFNDPAKVLVAGLVGEGGSIDVARLMAAARAGLPLLKKGAKNLKQEAAKALKGSAKKSFVSLVNKRITELPAELRSRAREIFHLKLDGSKIRALPDWIGEFENLQELSVRECALDTLPAGIGKLKKLRVLDAANNYWRQPLPADLGDLESLRVLNLDGCPQELPASFARLRLEDFSNQGMSSSRWEAFPEVLCVVTTLRRLNVPGHAFRGGIPHSINQLRELQFLSLDRSLCYATVLDLSGLVKLRELVTRGIGNRSYDRIPHADILRNAQIPTSLERLTVDAWGEHDELGAKRGPLERLPEWIGSLPNLKFLSASSCELVMLEPLEKCPVLEEADLGTISYALWQACEEFMSTHPRTKITAYVI